MKVSLRDELDRALDAMEASFHVNLIGTFGDALVAAPADAVAADWLGQNGPDFDQFPVRRGPETIGVLHREQVIGRALVRDVMQPLREGLVVSAHMPITDLIPQLKETPYRLVLRGAQIDGLVTQSDLLKLPVRMVTFSLLTHLEQLMGQLISVNWPQEEMWLLLLKPGRQEKVRGKQSLFSAKRMNPPLLELTDFCDKRDLCGRLIADEKAFHHELRAIEELRNQLAHAGTFLDLSQGRSGVVAFATRFESALRWISALENTSAALKAQG